jgi:nucleoid-associated protein YgaU
MLRELGMTQGAFETDPLTGTSGTLAPSSTASLTRVVLHRGGRVCFGSCKRAPAKTQRAQAGWHVNFVNKFVEGETMPDQFEQLKQKYQPVLTKIQEEGAELQNVNMDGNQLFVKATAVSEASKNRIWDAIKAVDPNFADLKHDIEVRQGEQSYTVQPGDNLSKISRHFYGDANKYPVIAKANNLEDPDKIKVGQKLVIPAAA